MNTIKGTDFKEMLLSGAAHLSNRHDAIDALNVFPVPDGDTGTNMSMTFTSGVKEAIQACTDDLSLLAKTLSKGLLMGARGNSMSENIRKRRLKRSSAAFWMNRAFRWPIRRSCCRY